MIQLGSYTFKNLIMESLFKLKSSERKFRGVIVAHDMTAKERQECKELVQDAKLQETQDVSGEFIYRVRAPPGKMRITKIRVRT